MEIKLFGRSLFEVKKSVSFALLTSAETKKKTSKYLPDFYTSGGGGSISSLSNSIISIDSLQAKVSGKKKEAPAKKAAAPLTPKGIFELKMLHDKTFILNTNSAYVDEQLADFKDKLALIRAEEYDMRNGVDEITSVIVRLENRKRYAAVKDFFEQYPYTTTARINGLIKEHENLKLGQIAQFMADLPKEAVDVMKEYNANTARVCSKQAVFYIIAEKKDFEKTNSRRDPILLVQSPFGHVWNICGAWDKEMLLVDEL